MNRQSLLLLFLAVLILLIWQGECKRNDRPCRTPDCPTRRTTQKNQNNDDDDKPVGGPIDSAIVWDKYRSELIKFLSKGSKKTSLEALQLVTTPIPAEWDRKPEDFQAFANNQPKYGSEWSFRGGKTFSDAYAEFVTNLDVPTLSVNARLQQQLDAMYDDEAQLQIAYEKAESQCIDAYKTASSYTRGTFEEFLAKSCSSVSYAEESWRDVRAKMNFYGRMVYGSDKAYLARKAIVQLTNVPENERRFIELVKLKDFVARNQQGLFNSFLLKITSVSEYSRSEAKWSSFSFSLGIPSFFSIGVGGSKKSMKTTTRNEDFGMTFGAKSWMAIKVLPDPSWFSSQVVQEWAKGPFRNGKTFGMFFGQSGKMSMVPRTFFVIYKPYVELILNREDHDAFQKAKSFGINLNIGPLSFNFNKSSTKSSSSQKENLFQYRIESNDETPQLIAVDHSFLPPQ